MINRTQPISSRAPRRAHPSRARQSTGVDRRAVGIIQFRVRPAKHSAGMPSEDVAWSDYTITNQRTRVVRHMAPSLQVARARELARTRKLGVTPLFEFRLRQEVNHRGTKAQRE